MKYRDSAKQERPKEKENQTANLGKAFCKVNKNVMADICREHYNICHFYKLII